MAIQEVACGNCLHPTGEIDDDCPCCDGTGYWPFEEEQA